MPSETLALVGQASELAHFSVRHLRPAAKELCDAPVPLPPFLVEAFAAEARQVVGELVGHESRVPQARCTKPRFDRRASWASDAAERRKRMYIGGGVVAAILIILLLIWLL